MNREKRTGSAAFSPAMQLRHRGKMDVHVLCEKGMLATPFENRRRNALMNEDELTVEVLRTLARQAGLALEEDDLTAVLPGVRRNLESAAAVRRWASLTVEPQVGNLREGEPRR